MADPNIGLKAATAPSPTVTSLIDITSDDGKENYGKLLMAANTSASLLVVFGGIDVYQKPSGTYMWDYMNAGMKAKFHIFVARNSKVEGLKAYNQLKSTLKAQGGTWSQEILYLFSGGWRPGKDVLSQGASQFSWIYLVDIWMGNSESADFYTKLVDANAKKITYVYTDFGANNATVRNYIAKKAYKAIHVDGSTMDVHMSTNTAAVAEVCP